MTRIHVEIREAGWHSWPTAPPNRYYLAYNHRHLFHFRVEMDVRHDEREVEFHDLMDEIRVWLPRDGEYGPASCERIARDLLARLLQNHKGRRVAVTVSEDGEAGATIEEGE